jgi:mono/diheme cytochrome c family protein
MAALLLLACAGCRQDMHDQPKYTAYKASDFFPDGRSARPLVEGTVAQGHLNEDELLYTGRVGGQPATQFPFAIDDAVMRRGRERYDIFCSPCHGLTGEGDGMVVQRGYRRPPSFHIDRLRQAPPGSLYDVMTNGFGAMPDYAAQIPVRDRWAIAAYIRALQLSQNATVAEIPPDARGRLK